MLHIIALSLMILGILAGLFFESDSQLDQARAHAEQLRTMGR